MLRTLHFFGIILTLGFSFLVLTPSALAVDCVGGSSGNVGTCSSIASCTGNQETPTQPVCKSGQICCVAPDALPPGEKLPKDPPILPPSPTTCSVSVFSNGSSVTRTGTCQVSTDCSSASGYASTSSWECTGGTVCCYSTGSNPGQNPGNSCFSSSIGKSGECSTPSVCNVSGGTDGGSSNCTIGGDICCIPAATGGGGSSNDCANAGGRCATISGGCSTSETSSILSCNDNARTCCMSSSTGTNPGTGTGTPGASGTITCPANYEPVAGVCFPKGTGLSEKSVLDIIGALLGWLLAIFGFIALLGFIISGLQYLTAAGNEGQAETAKRNMQYSVIGIIVALSGWIVIKAVDALLNANSWI